MGSSVLLLLGVGVVALACIAIALTLSLLCREVRALRLPKLRKPLLDYLVQATASHAARLKDHAMSDEVLQGLHAVTAFAQHGVKEYDRVAKAGAVAPPSLQSSALPSVMDGIMSEAPIRVPGPPPDGTSSAA